MCDHPDGVAARTRERVAGCDRGRDAGRPACPTSAQRGTGNEPPHRPATTAVLDTALERL
ncbi:hypothetical protein DU504_03360 [Haloplanus salinus]|uniref:Uncharacterized protein n=1 Tax=Haloplanus salinus TaxID=1126245 RepID=A0A368NAX4_9EURY|nr:hypothetical protein DU504_03360 [Haloplanus salinus]